MPSATIRVVLAALLALPLAAAEIWRPTTWAGAPAWTAEIGEATAIVAPAAGRLVWFGPRGGRNLLFVPAGGAIAVGGTMLHGGHQCWLGPQARWVWPPPAAWEAGAAEAVVADGTLTLRSPPETKAPALVRTYRVADGGLRCGLAWNDPERGWHAMHVVQVPKEMQVDPVEARPLDGVPAGVRFAVDRLGDVLPDNCLRAGDRLTLRPGKVGAKVFLPAQPLRGRLDGWTLALLPGAVRGRLAGQADQGLPTQVMLTEAAMPYLELEQCGDLLLPDASGSAGVEMELRLER